MKFIFKNHMKNHSNDKRDKNLIKMHKSGIKKEFDALLKRINLVLILKTNLFLLLCNLYEKNIDKSLNLMENLF